MLPAVELDASADKLLINFANGDQPRGIVALVVTGDPSRDDRSRVVEVAEDRLVQELIARAAVEGLKDARKCMAQLSTKPSCT
jgi:hypothetical protein